MIANLNHTLIVSTYRFGRVGDHPFSVTELAAGISGKDWLYLNPTVEQQTSVWQQYTRALRFIHSKGGIDGDPHLGNVLIFQDTEDVSADRYFAKERGTGIKVADTGTSEFWLSYDAILRREGPLILETAGRLFAGQNFKKLWFHRRDLSHKVSLQVLDDLSAHSHGASQQNVGGCRRLRLQFER